MCMGHLSVCTHLSSSCSSAGSCSLLLQVPNPGLTLSQQLSNVWCLLSMLCSPRLKLSLSCIPLLLCLLQLLLQIAKIGVLLLDLLIELLQL